MVLLRFLLSVLALHVPWVFGQENYPSNEIEELWFEQKLDHFDPQNPQKWQQRYFVNHKAYKSGGPAFLFVGGEFEIDKPMVTEYSWIDYAKRFGALCFVLEHRYYGKSRSVEDLSLPNLKYLTTHQALADLATFIVDMREKYNLSSDVKWIAFGASYSGLLSAWLRVKYPHLVYGAVSSSAPIDLCLEIDYVNLGLSIYYYRNNGKCANILRDGCSQLLKHVETEKERRVVDVKFNLCSPLEKSVNNSRDMSTLYYNIAYAIAQAAQYDTAYKLEFYNIKSVCDHVITAGTALDGLGAAIRYLNKDNKCLDYLFENKVNALRNTSWPVEKSTYTYGRAWQYQICNEIGVFITSIAELNIFHNKFPIKYRALECQYAFGEQYDVHFLANAVKTTNSLYGGVYLESTNILFVEGKQDPWMIVGYKEKFRTNILEIMINDTTHCEDFYPATEKDSPALKAARFEIASIISTWLNSEH